MSTWRFLPGEKQLLPIVPLETEKEKVDKNYILLYENYTRHMNFLLELEDLISIAVSILCGSIIGFEREYNNKSAGFRTIILISLGSTIFTIVSKHGTGSDDRIAANIITGIGFIGAGVIFKDKLSVLGLTTAAVIWTTAGIGMATGIGYHMLAFGLTIFTIIILSLFGRVEYLIDQLPHTKAINLTFHNTDINNIYILEETLKNKKLKVND
jgi:putative Mg2+ transporter-C (MgtC) family protein